MNISGDREAGGECRAFARRGVDAEPALMAVEDMLNNGKAQAGAPALAAGQHIYPVEAFGQPGQMLWCNAGSIIGHRNQVRPGQN